MGFNPQPREGFSMEGLVQIVSNATISAKNKLNIIKNNKSSISIADMFDMQMLMNHLSQLSEMSSAVVQASNQSLMGIARGVKGG